MDEFQRIGTLFRPLAAPEALNLEDDAAWLQPPAGHTLVATKDALVAGVHFVGDEDPALIARKCLRVNLSDIAAMGARPYGYLLANQLPREVTDEWLARFAEGLQADQAEFDLKLFGGDSVSTPGPMAFSVTMLGLLPAGANPLRRNGARVNDAVCVSGTLGQAALGLRCVRERVHNQSLIARYHLPQPRVPLGILLRGVAHAAMDVSDGLLQDAGHMARASGLRIEIDARDVPCDTSGAFGTEDALRAALGGGDDYELLFTLPADALGALRVAAEHQGIRITRIGTAVTGQGVDLFHSPISPESVTGWMHI